MRTTLTLDPDVARRVKARMAEKKLTMKQVVNEGLRNGLAATSHSRKVRFKVEPHSFGLRPGFDRDKMNQLLDELETDEVRKSLSQ